MPFNFCKFCTFTTAISNTNILNVKYTNPDGERVCSSCKKSYKEPAHDHDIRHWTWILIVLVGGTVGGVDPTCRSSPSKPRCRPHWCWGPGPGFSWSPASPPPASACLLTGLTGRSAGRHSSRWRQCLGSWQRSPPQLPACCCCTSWVEVRTK